MALDETNSQNAASKGPQRCSTREMIMRLADYLKTTFRDGINYRDAAHLCLAMFCVDILPSGVVDDKLSMEVIAEAFADLAKHGLIKDYVSYESVLFGANYHSIEDEGHWIEVQASSLKKGMKCEIDRVERLKKQMRSDQSMRGENCEKNSGLDLH